MSRQTSFFSRISLACLLSLATAIPAIAAEPKAPETKQDRDARMAWWRDARFGMFIHWGLYAVPAGQWNGKFVPPGGGEWIMNTANIPVPEYEALAKKFNPGQVRSGRVGAAGQGGRHEVHRHHVEAPRRLQPVRHQGHRLQHRQGHALRARTC